MPTLSPIVLGNRLPINLPEPQKLDNNSWLQVSAFNNFAGGIRSDNLLYMWGINNTYQVGDGTTTNKSLPVQVSSSSFSQISAGFDHSAALTTDNTLFMWGNNASTFIQTINFSWNSISSNGGHNLAIRNDGLLFTWGLNTSGQLGDGSTLNRSSPIQIGTSSYAFVAAGNDHSLAVIGKSLYAWGLNSFFQNGQGTTTANRSSPVLITTAAISFVSVSAGNQFNAYVLSDGSLYTFGKNNVYQLGDLTQTSRSNPVAIGTERSYVSVSAGSDHSLAIDTVGNLYVWGNNLSIFAPIPTTISSWSQVNAGDLQTAALTTTGKAYFWGSNATYGMLGTGDTLNRSSPTQLFAGTSSFVQVQAAQFMGAAIDTEYKLYTWGENTWGQLGIGLTTNRSTPQQVNYLNKSYSQVALSTRGETYAIDTDNKLWTWGLNNVGQGGVVLNNSVTWSTLAVGSSFIIAIKSDGTLWGWGRNSEGQLGQSDTINRSLPTQIGSSSWKLVSTGTFQSFAIRDDNLLFAWGTNTYGNLGDGTTVNKSSPSLVNSAISGVSNYVQVDAANGFTLAVDYLGRAWSWGRNNYGQLGINLQATTTANRSNPVQVSLPVGVSVTQVATGENGSNGYGFAISTNGTLYAWGINNFGQLGNSTTIDRSSPIQIGSDSWIKVIASTSIEHSGAIRNDGTLFTWGRNLSGALGLGDVIDRSSPVQVTTLPNIVVDIAYGSSNAGLLLTDGTIWGMGNVNSRSAPAQIGNRNDWTSLAKTHTDGVAFAAKDTNNYAYVWGNQPPIAGTGQTSINLSAPTLVGYAGVLQPNLLDRFSSPTQVASTSSWSQIVAGDSYALAIDSNYKLFGWGNNASSQVGDNTTINQYSPVQIGNSSWISVSAGLNHALAVRSDNTLWTWGNSTAIGLVVEPQSFITAASGNNNTYAIDVRGVLWAWGDNAAGQLGDLRTTNRSSPVMVGYNLAMPQNNVESNYTQVFAGNSFAFATDSNYKLYAWGNNNAGQLGLNSTLSRSWPLQVGQLSWNNIAAGTDHTIGLDINQGIYAWGQYTTGELGIYDTGYSWNQIAGGLALRADNTLWSWGNNVGDGTTIFKSSPVQIGSTEWSSIAMIYDSTFVKAAIKTNGTLWSWGTNTNGQLGDGTTISQSSPVQVAGSWSQISIQSNHAAALNSASIMYTWGLNDKGQLGDGTTVNKSSPVLLTATGGFSTTSWLSVSVGYSHTFAFNNVRAGYVWGDNSSGQLGLNLGTAAHRSLPVLIASDKSWQQISSGGLHTLGVISTNALAFAWGNNLYGQTGTSVGTAVNRSSPTAIGATDLWHSVVAGAFSSFGKRRNNSNPFDQAYSWGTNSNGELGLNDTVQRSSPTVISAVNTNSWKQIGVNSAIDFNNAAYVWGVNSALFNTTIVASTPVVVGGFRWPVDKNYLPTKINNNSYLQIGVGNSYTIALDSNNTLYGWGLNTSGQLGDTTAVNKSSPTQLNAFSWLQIATGYDHTLAIRDDTTLWTWGNSGAISLGVEPQSWTAISTGLNHNLAIRSDGALFAWGLGTSGALGDNSVISKSSPTVIGSSSWSQVAAGQQFSLALDINNYLYTWGVTNVGQTGRIGVARSNPTQIFNFVDKSQYLNNLTRFDVTYTSATSYVPFSSSIAGEFIGGSQAITVSPNNQLAFGTGDFTIECWLWPNVQNFSPNRGYVIHYGALFSEQSIGIGFAHQNFDIQKFVPGNTTTGTPLISNTAFYAQTWYHVAVVRQSGTLSVYIDGTIRGSISDTTSYDPTILALRIGGGSVTTGTGAMANPFIGNISNVRVVKGVAVYTGNFTVPTTVLTATQSAGTNISAINAGETVLLALTDSSSISIPTYTSIEAGLSHAYAIDSNNKLFGWGLNTSGQVLPYGNYPQNTYNSSVPVQVGLGYYNTITFGNYSGAGIRNPDRFLFTWGLNAVGQLGTGDTINRSIPIQIGNNSWKQVAQGNQHTLAIRDDDTLWTWGVGTLGQLGYGTAANRSSPVQVAGSWKFIAAGSLTSAGIRDDGTLWTWGVATNGQLGYGLTDNRSSPVQVSGGGSWISISAGQAHMLAIDSNNIVYGWGANQTFGQLGNNTTIDRSVPTLLASPFNTISFAQVSAGFSHSAGITSTGLLYTWGGGSIGELGYGQVNRSTPTQITQSTGIFGEPIPSSSNSWTYVEAGYRSTAAINNTNLYVWGLNTLGRLGLGDTLNRSYPTQTGIGYSWQSVKLDHTADASIGMFFRADNTIWTVGDNQFGSLGDNTTVNKSTPVFLGAASFSTPVQINNSSWSLVSAGSNFTHAINPVGQLYNWGLNDVSQLGNVNTINRNDTLVQVLGSWSKVSSGTSHSLAIKSDSTLWAWGGASAIVLSNVTVNSWTQIAGNDNSSHCAAIRSDGTLWVWGLNSSGQMGDGTTIDKSSPTQIGAGSWSFVSVGTSNTMAVKNNGDLYAWGNNTNGQLGDNTAISKSSPVFVSYGSWSQIALNGAFAFGLKSNVPYAWGLNSSGQLGNYTTINRSTPVIVNALATSVIDGSDNNLAVTITGPIYGSNEFSPFANTTAIENVLNSGAHLSLASNAVLALNSSAWTIECWVLLKQLVPASTQAMIIHNGEPYGSAGTYYWIAATTSSIYMLRNDGLAAPSFVSSPQINTWYHIAAVLNAGTVYLYGNGILSTSFAVGAGYGDQQKVYIGGGPVGGTGEENTFPGLISNLRIVKNVAVYTGNFTVPTSPLQKTQSAGTNISAITGSNTSLLLFNTANSVVFPKYSAFSASSSNFGLAVSDVGLLYAWGNNAVYQLGLGDNTTTNRSNPTLVPTPLLSFTAVSAGASHSLALDSNNKVWTWGQGSSIGVDFNSWTQISSGEFFTLALRSDGRLFTWGYNAHGQLAQGDVVNRSNPVLIGASSWTFVNAGRYTAYAVKADNTTWAWGYNLWGAVGDNTTINKSSPVQVSFPAGISITQVSAGESHALAVASSGALFAWGSNSFGVLGLNDTIARSSPVQIGSQSWSKVSAGWSHSTAINSLGQLFAWGANDLNQLGNNTFINRSSPVQIGFNRSNATLIVSGSWSQVSAGLNHNLAIDSSGKLYTWGNQNAILLVPQLQSWSVISAGDNGAFTLGIRSDGLLYGWGLNSTGQLGTFDTINRSSPTLVSGLGWKRVATGTAHSLAIREDDTLWAWGNNATWQLGNGLNVSLSSPVQIGASLGLSWTSVAAGASHSGAINSLGKLYMWGAAVGGAIGDNQTAANRSSPTLIGNSSWTSVSLGSSFTAGITSIGTLFAWGLNSLNQLGDATTIDKSSPVQIGNGLGLSFINVSTGLDHSAAISTNYKLYAWGSANAVLLQNSIQSWTKLSAGVQHTVAIRSDGLLYAWGLNNAGQLGDSTTVNRSSPVIVTSDLSWSQVAAGDSHTLAIRSNGLVYAWGLGTSGQLGFGTAANRSSPVLVTSVSSYTQVAAGAAHSLALKLDSRLETWGLNTTGELGDNTTISKSTPTLIGSTSWVDVSAGSSFSTGITVDGKLYAWGLNNTYQIGDGTTTPKSNPVLVGGDASFTQISTSFTHVSTGVDHNLAIDANSSLWAWGNASAIILTRLQGVTSWTKMAAGASHTLAIRSDGMLFAWGLNNAGQLGDGTIVTKSSPTIIGNFSWNAVGAGQSHSFAIRSDGILFAWGLGTSGQLGLETSSVNRSSPVQIGTSSWTSVSGGNLHSAGIDSLGLLYTWGASAGGQTGQNNTTTLLSPVQLGSDSWISVTAGTSHTAGIKTDNTMWAWGVNSVFQIGDGTTITKSSPVQIDANKKLTNSWTQISSEFDHTLAIDSNSKLWVWGNQLATPLLTTAFSWSQISAGNLFTVAIRNDGYLFAWGAAAGGALGDGQTATTRSSPVLIGADQSWSRVSAGNSYAFAIRADSTLWAWGLNSSGQLGDNSTISKSSPVLVSTGASSYTQINAGSVNALAIDTDFRVWSWGLNNAGQLGIGLTTDRSNPTLINTIPSTTSSYTQISAGNSFAAVIDTNNELFMFGLGSLGRLGNNTTINRSLPTIVRGSASFYTQVASGFDHTLAQAATTGNLFSWGNNNVGQLGTTNTVNRSNPAQVSQPATVGSTSWGIITAGNSWSIGAIDNKLYAWGLGSSGQLGTNTSINRSQPTILTGVGSSSWTAISAGVGGTHTVGIQSTGLAYGFGLGTSGQLGDYTLITKSVPVQVGSTAILNSYFGIPTQVGTSSWTAINAGTSFSLARLSDNNIYAWGLNSSGQLGNNSSINRSSPTLVANGAASFIMAGGAHGFAWSNTANFRPFGLNNAGQLGVNDAINRSSAAIISLTGIETQFGTPTRINNTLSWTSVGAGQSFSLATDSTFKAYAWGVNSLFQLGDNTSVGATRSSPTQVGGITSFSLVAAGKSHGVGLTVAGNLLADGSSVNSGGTSTSPAYSFTNTPFGGTYSGVFDNTVAKVVVAANTSNRFDITTNWTMECWVYPTLSNYSTIAPVLSHNYYGGSNGTYCNMFNFLGDKVRYSVLANADPLVAPTLSYFAETTFTVNTWIHLAMSNPSGSGTGYFYVNGVQIGTVLCLISTTSNGLFIGAAANQNGSLYPKFTGLISNVRFVNGLDVYLGNFTPPTQPLTATQPAGTNIRAITGTETKLVMYSAPANTNQLYAWGSSVSGQLGDNATVNRSSITLIGSTALNTSVPVPTKVGDSSWTQVAAGNSFTSAIRTDFTIWSWGLGTNGQLGNNSAVTRSSPVQISGAGTSSWTQVVAGGSHALAISTANLLYGWGLNSSGQLGDISATQRNVPTIVSPTTIAASQYPAPTLIDNTNSYVQVAAGVSFSAALRSNYSLYVWGLNNLGQLGDNSSITKSSPTLLAASTINRESWTLISTNATASNMSAISNQQLYNWGYNPFGGLGNNSTINRSSPVQVFSGIVNNLGMIVPTKINLDISFTQISAGISYSLARKAVDRTIVAWGTNQFGQYGDNTTVSASYPVIVGQSPIVTDSSQATLTVTTPSGQPKSTIDSPFNSGSYNVSTYGGSLYLDGSSRGLIAAAATLNIFANASGCSMEIWFKPTATGADQMLLTQDSGGAATAQIFQLFVTATNLLSFTYFTTSARASAVILTSTVTVNVNSWNHALVTLTSSTAGTIRLFLNGALVAISGSASPYAVTARATGIGSFNSSLLNQFTGFLTNLRMVSGSIPTDYQTASTTIGATIFTVPTSPLTETSQGATSTDVVYLGMRAIPDYTPSNVVAIGSTTAFLDTDSTIDTFGLNASGQFGNGTTINRSLPVVLGENFNSLNTGFNVPVQVTAQNSWTAVSAGTSFSLAKNSDTFTYAWGLGTSGQLGRTFSAITRSAPTIVGPDQSVTVLDSSIYTNSIIGSGTFYDTVNVPTAGAVAGTFNGTGDYLRCDAATSSLTSTSNSFTIEGYANPSIYTGFTTGRYIIGINGISGGDNRLLIGVDRLWYNRGVSASGGAFAMPLNTWTHFAVSYNGSTSTLRYFINGNLIYTGGVIGTPLSSNTFLIGTEADGSNGGGLSNWFSGSLSSIRVTNKALYTGAFTPPTGILTNTSVGTSGPNVAASLTSSEVLFLTYTTFAASITATAPPVFNSFGAGNNQALGIQSDNTLYAWGLGTSGQLGIGVATSRSSITLVGSTGQIINTYTTSPVQVLPGTSNYTQVFAGQSFSIFQNSTGNYYVWGLNTSGQLGDQGTISTSVPSQLGISQWNVFDQSVYTQTVTRVGTFYSTAVVPFSPLLNSVSGSFDGKSYLTLPTGYLNFLHNGSTDYTVEFYFYTSKNAASLYNGILTTGPSTAQRGFTITLNTNVARNVTMNIASVGSYAVTLNSGSIYNVNAWNHAAVTFNATTNLVSLYVNGVLRDSDTAVGITAGAASLDPTIGNYSYPAGEKYLSGYLSNFRIVKKIVYTGNFTVPTSPLQTSQSSGTNINSITASETSLLLYNVLTSVVTNPNALNFTGFNTYTSTVNAIGSDSKLYVWGANPSGQLGQSDTVSRSSVTLVGNGNYLNTGTVSPVQISFGLPNSWSTVAAGKSFSLAKDVFGSVYAWGLGTSGQIDNNTAITRSSPTLVGGVFSSVLDVSGQSNTITKFGTNFSTSVIPFAGAVSGYFNGTTDYLRCDGALSLFTAGSDSFTIEGFIYPLTGLSSEYFIGINGLATGENNLLLGITTYSYDGVLASLTTPFATNTWTHFAITYDHSAVGDKLKIFAGGIQVQESSAIKTAALDINSLLIGAEADGPNGSGVGNYFNGYITSIRITKQTLYSGTFTPPSDILTNSSVGTSGANVAASLSGTVTLLTYTTQAATIVGGLPVYYNSISAGGTHTAAIKSDSTLYTWGLGTSGQLGIDNAITQSSPVLVGNQLDSNTKSPILAASASWSQASAGVSYSLALNQDGSIWAFGLNNTYQLGQGDLINRSSIVQIGSGVTPITDTSINGFNVQSSNNPFMTTTNNPFASGDYNVSVYGGSINMNSGQIRIPDSVAGTALQMGTGDFTIEGWFYPQETTAYIYTKGSTAGGGTGMQAYFTSLNPTGYIYFFDDTGNTNTIFANGYVSRDVWQHVAFVRSSNVIYCYVNGIQRGSVATSSNFNQTQVFTIGTGKNLDAMYTGYISNFRVVKGVAVYTSNFTVPTEPLTAVTGTQLLIGSFINTALTYDYVNAGNSTSMAIKSDYGLYTWGLGTSGILGYQSVTTRSVPAQVGTSSWSTVSSGLSHALGVESDSTLFAWGGNTTGQLGTNTVITRSSPVQVQGINLNTTSPTLVDGLYDIISAGLSYTAGIYADTLYTWGLNTSGQLGDGTTITKSSPTIIGTGSILELSDYNLPITNVGAYLVSTKNPFTVSTTQYATYGGSGYFNGNGAYIQANYLAYTTSENFTLEFWMQIEPGAAIPTYGMHITGYYGGNSNSPIFFVSISTAYNLSFQIRGTGGANEQVLTGTTTLAVSTWYHIAIVRNSGVVNIYIDGVSDGSISGSNQELSTAPTAIGGFYSVGNGVSNVTNGNKWFKGYISNLRYVKGVAVYTGTFTEPNLGKLSTSGASSAASYPSTSNVNTSFSSSSTNILTLITTSSTAYTNVFIGSAATYALDATDNLYAWGLGTTGQISGFASIINRSAPNQIGNQYIVVNMSSPVQIAAGSWTSISAGSSASAAIRQDYKLFTWGVGTAGKLGDGTTVLKSSPVQIGTNSWSQVSMSASHTAAIDSTSRLFTWGLNSSGQLGLTNVNAAGDVVNRSSPVLVGSAFTGVLDVSTNALTLTKTGTSFSTTIVPLTGSVAGSFDGNTDRINISANSALAIGTTGTLEFWIRANSFSNFRRVYDSNIGGSAALNIGVYSTGQLYFVQPNNTEVYTTATLAINIWYHVAFVINSGQLTTYVNGASTQMLYLSAPYTVTGIDISDTSALYAIGGDTGGGFSFDGYISNLRLVKGVAVYTDNFVVPTSILTATQSAGVNISAITGTQTSLLTYTTQAATIVGGIATSFSKVAAGSSFTAATTTVNRLFMWGIGTGGILGNNNTVSFSSPIQVTSVGTNSWTSVTTGGATAGGIQSDGSLYMWGSNAGAQNFGDIWYNAVSRSNPIQFGNTIATTTAQTRVPIKNGNSSWTQVEAGNNSSIGLFYRTAGQNGLLFAWGLNSAGQLGDNTTINKSSPVQIGVNTYLSVTTGTSNAGAIGKATT